MNKTGMFQAPGESCTGSEAATRRLAESGIRTPGTVFRRYNGSATPQAPNPLVRIPSGYAAAENNTGNVLEPCCTGVHLTLNFR